MRRVFPTKTAHQLLGMKGHLEAMETSPLSKFLWWHLSLSLKPPLQRRYRGHPFLCREKSRQFLAARYFVFFAQPSRLKRVVSLQCGNPGSHVIISSPARAQPQMKIAPLHNLVLHSPILTLLVIDVSARGGRSWHWWNVLSTGWSNWQLAKQATGS